MAAVFKKPSDTTSTVDDAADTDSMFKLECLPVADRNVILALAEKSLGVRFTRRQRRSMPSGTTTTTTTTTIGSEKFRVDVMEGLTQLERDLVSVQWLGYVAEKYLGTNRFFCKYRTCELYQQAHAAHARATATVAVSGNILPSASTTSFTTSGVEDSIAVTCARQHDWDKAQTGDVRFLNSVGGRNVIWTAWMTQRVQAGEISAVEIEGGRDMKRGSDGHGNKDDDEQEVEEDEEEERMVVFYERHDGDDDRDVEAPLPFDEAEEDPEETKETPDDDKKEDTKEKEGKRDGGDDKMESKKSKSDTSVPPPYESVDESSAAFERGERRRMQAEMEALERQSEFDAQNMIIVGDEADDGGAPTAKVATSINSGVGGADVVKDNDKEDDNAAGSDIYEEEQEDNDGDIMNGYVTDEEEDANTDFQRRKAFVLQNLPP